MSGFTNTRKKALKQRKKARILSFNLLFRSSFNLAVSYVEEIHHISPFA